MTFFLILKINTKQIDPQFYRGKKQHISSRRHITKFSKNPDGLCDQFKC